MNRKIEPAIIGHGVVNSTLIMEELRAIRFLPNSEVKPYPMHWVKDGKPFPAPCPCPVCAHDKPVSKVPIRVKNKQTGTDSIWWMPWDIYDPINQQLKNFPILPKGVKIKIIRDKDGKLCVTIDAPWWTRLFFWFKTKVKI